MQKLSSFYVDCLTNFYFCSAKFLNFMTVFEKTDCRRRQFMQKPPVSITENVLIHIKTQRHENTSLHSTCIFILFLGLSLMERNIYFSHHVFKILFFSHYFSAFDYHHVTNVVNTSLQWQKTRKSRLLKTFRFKK